MLTKHNSGVIYSMWRKFDNLQQIKMLRQKYSVDKELKLIFRINEHKQSHIIYSMNRSINPV